ncbi:MAG TPA: glycosyltransferase family 1 protein [Bacteroidetes bacterium]|nr:glycosyltransferase family 1 protein [Bacteroidota bacterium]
MIENPETVIAEVCFSPSWGGLEHYCADSAARLASRGHRVVPFVRAGSPLEDRLVETGFSPVTCRPSSYFSPITTLKLARRFRARSVGAVHLHRTQDLGVVLPSAALAGVKIRVLTLQMESSRRKRDLYHRWVYGGLTRVLTITGRMRQLVTDNVAVDPDKVRCLYYGIDGEGLRAEAAARDEIRSRWKVPSDAFVVGIVGRLEPMKGQETVLGAAALLQHRIPKLVVMIVGDETVGKVGEMDRLKRLAAQTLTDARVVFTGYRHPPGSIVPAFDVSALATRKETFGLVILEAQALGVPVVASAAGGVPEIIEDGVNGRLVKPGDAEALAEAIEELYRSPELRRSIGEAGMRNVGERFSLKAQIEGLERALRGE